MRRSKKASKLRVTDLCEGNSPVTDEFPSQRVSNVENVHLMTSSWYKLQPYNTNIDDLVQYCSNSSALAMELLQSCTKSSIYNCNHINDRSWRGYEPYQEGNRDDRIISDGQIILCSIYRTHIFCLNDIGNRVFWDRQSASLFILISWLLIVLPSFT